jgi:hypothetical protein
MNIEVLSIVGSISGILAVAGIVYGFGVKFSRLETKVTLIWNVFVEDFLRNQVKTGMLTHHSPYHRTELSSHLGELVPPLIISKLIRKKIVNDVQLTSAIIKEMGYLTILEDSRQLNISVQEFLALSVGTVRGIESQHNG